MPPQSRWPGSFVSSAIDGNKMEPGTILSTQDGRRIRLMRHPAAQAAPSLQPPQDPQSTRLYLQDREGMWHLLGPSRVHVSPLSHSLHPYLVDLRRKLIF